MPRTLTRYANRLLLANLGLVGVVLGSIFQIKYLLNYLIKASSGKLPADLVLSMAGLVFISSLQYIVPLTVFFALLVTLSRLRESHELTAMTAFGQSPVRIFTTFWPTLATVALFLAMLLFWGMPWAESQQYRLLAEAGADPATRWLRPGAFSPLPGGGVVYVSEVAEGRAGRVNENLFLCLPTRPGEADQVVTAPVAFLSRREGGLDLILENGTIYRGLGEDRLALYQFEEGRWRTQLPAVTGQGDRPRTKPLTALWHSQDRADQAELHWRLAVLVMVLTLAWSTQVLAWAPGRRRGSGALVSLIVLYAIYFNALTVSVSWYRKGLVDSVWVIHAFHLLPVAWAQLVQFWRIRRYARAG